MTGEGDPACLNCSSVTTAAIALSPASC